MPDQPDPDHNDPPEEPPSQHTEESSHQAPSPEKPENAHQTEDNDGPSPLEVTSKDLVQGTRESDPSRSNEDPLIKEAKNKMYGPGLSLLITGILGFLVFLAYFVVNLMYHQADNFSGMSGDLPTRIGFVIGVSSPIFLSLFSAAIAISGYFMMQLKYKSLCYIGAIASVIPCISPMCIVGIPFGIWALVTLSKERVAKGFELHSSR